MVEPKDRRDPVEPGRLADATEEAEVRQLLHALGIHTTADLLRHIEAAFRDKNAAIEALTVERDALRTALAELHEGVLEDGS